MSWSRAVALTALAPGGMLWLAAVWWVASGFTSILGNGPLMSLLQTTVPSHLQGRVLSPLNTLGGLAAPVGLALATPLGELPGIQGLFVPTGALSVSIAPLGFVSPTLRKVDQAQRPAS